jgi:hypothetical protein
VRRAALALRDWPGPAERGRGRPNCSRLIDRCKRAGRLALILRPAGYDGEVVYLITLLQNLGRLVVHYHFPDEAQQIRRLMQPAPPARGRARGAGHERRGRRDCRAGRRTSKPSAPPWRATGAWTTAVLHMIRRHAAGHTRAQCESDDDMLRTVASCANEAVRRRGACPAHVPARAAAVVQRYGRVLNLTCATCRPPCKASRRFRRAHAPAPLDGTACSPPRHGP